MTVLVVTVDAGGNLPPALGIGRALAARGEEAVVLGHPHLRGAVQSAGLPFEEFRTAADYDPRRPRRTWRAISDFTSLVVDRAIGTDAVELAHRVGARVVLVDCLAAAGLQACSEDGLTTVALVHTFEDYVRRLGAGPVGLLARARGTSMRTALSGAAAHLVTARADMDPATGLPSRRHHVGVVWQDVPVRARPQPRPRVLVSLSTNWFPGQERVLSSVLTGLAPLPVDVVVTAGAHIDTDALTVPTNATLHRWLDHADVLATASLVIGHGGHSTTVRALSYGVPVLVLPMHPMLDQTMVGSSLERLGVGRLLEKRAAAERIGAAVEGMLGDAALNGAASRLGEDIRREDGAVRAAELIASL